MKRVLSLGDIAGVSSKATIDDENDINNGIFTQVRSRRNKRSKKTDAAQNQTDSNTPPQRNAAVPASQPTTTSDQASSPFELSELSTLRKTVDELKETVYSYSLIINNLTVQLNFVLSYLGINEHWPTVSSTVTASTEGTITTAATATTTTVAAAAAAATTAGASTYSGVIASARGSKSQPSSLKEVVVIAVHADRRDKERRANTVVVSGLMQHNERTDADCFRRLAMLELGADLQVKFTKRLGTAVGDRVQPLLVGLQSADEATNLVLRAKQLRRSTDEQIRRNVFINRNLTPLEAKFAYEERCRRRHQRSQHQHVDHHQYADVQQLPQTAVAGQPNIEPEQSRPARMIVNSQLRRDQQHSNGSTGYMLSSAYSQQSTNIYQQEQGQQQAAYQAAPNSILSPSS